jgi:hypothetical protein
LIKAKRSIKKKRLKTNISELQKKEKGEITSRYEVQVKDRVLSLPEAERPDLNIDIIDRMDHAVKKYS